MKSKNTFYLISLIVSLILLAILVYAYGGTDPAIHGHSNQELDISPIYLDTENSNVGIGTDSPDSKLHIVDGIVHVDNAYNAKVEIDKGNYNRLGYLTFKTTGIDRWFVGTPDSDDFGTGNEFLIGENYNGNPSLLIQNGTGNVGIGTTSPGAAIDISGTPTSSLGSPQLEISGRDTNSQYFTIGFGFNQLGTTSPPGEIGFLETSSSANTWGDLIFATRNVGTNTAPSERMRIDSDGNVGIGTTSPGALLEIQGATGSTTDLLLNDIGGASRLRLYTGSGVGTARNWQIASNDVSWGALSFKVSNAQGGDSQTAGTNVMTLLSSGNVGIGTATPSKKLDVAGTAKAEAFIAPAIRLRAPSALNVGGGTGGASYNIDWNTVDSIDNDFFTFTPGGTTITIDQAGWYEIKSTLVADNTGANRYSAWIRGYKSGVELRPGFRDKGYSRGSAYGDYLSVQANTETYFNAGDTFRIDWYRRSADQTDAVNIVSDYCNLIIRRVGD